MISDERWDLWDRQEGEPSLWYGRFHAFLLKGSDRTLLGVYNEWRESRGRPRTKCPARTWRDACKRWEWRERAEAYDRHLRDLRAAIALDGVKEAATLIAEAAPNAAAALIAGLDDDSQPERRHSANSLLDRSEKTASRRIHEHEISKDALETLAKAAMLALKYIPNPEDRDAYERELEGLVAPARD